MNQNDLNHDQSSLLPLPTREDVTHLEALLQHYFSDNSIKFPESLVDHFLKFHGGIPGKQCFDEPDGRTRMICRFCNVFVSDESKLPGPIIPSWRNRNHDVRLDYSISGFSDYFDYEERLAKSGCMLVPVAILDTAGNNAREEDEMDLLCLDFEDSKEPPVVTWCFESSWCDLEDTIKVADSFDEFLGMLYERPTDFHVSNETNYF